MSIHRKETPKGLRYQLRYRDPDGFQRKKSFLKKADAEREQNRINAAMDQGTYSDPSLGRTTFKQVAEDWMKGHRNRSTRQAVELRLRLHVYPVLGHKQVAKIKPSDMDDLARAVEHLSDSYQRVILTNASSVLGRAVRDRLIAENPAKGLKRPKVSDKPLIVWTPEQVHAMYEALPDRYALLVLLGSGLGLRQGEAFALSPDDINFPRREVHVRRQVKLFADGTMSFAEPKGQKTRTVPLPSAVADAVSLYMQQFPSRSVTLPWDGTRVGQGLPKAGAPVMERLLLTSRESAALNRNYINSRVWKPALIAAGLEPTRDNGCHALRHWFATTLVSAGTPMKTVSDYLGHADVAFTMRVYTHRTDDHDTNARKAVDDALTLPSAPVAPRAVV